MSIEPKDEYNDATHFIEPSDVTMMPFVENFLDLPMIQTILKGNSQPS